MVFPVLLFPPPTPPPPNPAAAMVPIPSFFRFPSTRPFPIDADDVFTLGRALVRPKILRHISSARTHASAREQNDRALLFASARARTLFCQSLTSPCTFRKRVIIRDGIMPTLLPCRIERYKRYGQNVYPGRGESVQINT